MQTNLLIATCRDLNKVPLLQAADAETRKKLRIESGPPLSVPTPLLLVGASGVHHTVQAWIQDVKWRPQKPGIFPTWVTNGKQKAVRESLSPIASLFQCDQTILRAPMLNKVLGRSQPTAKSEIVTYGGDKKMQRKEHAQKASAGEDVVTNP